MGSVGANPKLRTVAKLAFFVFLAAAVCAYAQVAGKSPVRAEIRWAVLEPGTNQPVAEADDVGYFNVKAKKNGYTELQALLPGAPSSSLEVTLSPGHSRAGFSTSCRMPVSAGRRRMVSLPEAYEANLGIYLPEVQKMSSLATESADWWMYRRKKQ